MDPSADASGRVLSADGTPIAWQRRGEGPPLVVVDPVMMDRTTSGMAGVAELLAAGHTVYTYDRRGKGESGDGEEYTPESEVDDLLAVVETAGGTADLLGTSSGAVLALRAASAVCCHLQRHRRRTSAHGGRHRGPGHPSGAG